MNAPKMRAIVAALTKAFPEGTWTFLSKKDCEKEQTFDPPCAFIKGSVWEHKVELTFDGELHVDGLFATPQDVDMTLPPKQIAQVVVASFTAAQK